MAPLNQNLNARAWSAETGQPPLPIGNASPTGSVARYDLAFAKRLPPEARAILTDIAEKGYEARLLSHELHLRRQETSEKIGKAKGRIAELTENLAGYTSGLEASVAAQREIIEEGAAELTRVDARASGLGSTAAACGRLVEAARDLVRRVGHGTPIAVHVGPTPQLRKSEDAEAAVESRRRRIRELEADLSRTQSAPKLSAEMKAQEIARIEFLATQGAPNAFRTIEEGMPIIWPTTSAEIIGQLGQPVVMPDFMAILAHLHKDAMIAAVTREIDLMADDENALSDFDKDSRIKQIKRDILATEREEVAFVRLANSQGGNILFRGDTDARALLGLADDMPAPRRD